MAEREYIPEKIFKAISSPFKSAGSRAKERRKRYEAKQAGKASGNPKYSFVKKDAEAAPAKPVARVRKKAANYSTSPAKNVTTRTPGTAKTGIRSTVKGGAGVTPRKATVAAPATTPRVSAAKASGPKGGTTTKAKTKRGGSGVKLMSPAEAKKVREARMSAAVDAGRKKRGAKPKAMTGKQIRTTAMPKRKKKRTSLEEFGR